MAVTGALLAAAGGYGDELFIKRVPQSQPAVTAEPNFGMSDIVVRVRPSGASRPCSPGLQAARKRRPQPN